MQQNALQIFLGHINPITAPSVLQCVLVIGIQVTISHLEMQTLTSVKDGDVYLVYTVKSLQPEIEGQKVFVIGVTYMYINLISWPVRG